MSQEKSDYPFYAPSLYSPPWEASAFQVMSKVIPSRTTATVVSLFQSSDGDDSSYMWGRAATWSYVIFGVFLIWILLLLIMTHYADINNNWLSGRPLTLAEYPGFENIEQERSWVEKVVNELNTDLEAKAKEEEAAALKHHRWCLKNNNIKYTARYCRVAVGVCWVLMLLACYCTLRRGVASMNESITNINLSVKWLHELIVTFSGGVDQFLVIEKKAVVFQNIFINKVRSVCVEGNFIFGVDAIEATDRMDGAIEEIQSFVDDINPIYDSVKKASSFLESLGELVNIMTWIIALSFVILCLHILLSYILVCGIYFVWKEKLSLQFQQFLQHVVTPCFCFTTLLCFLVLLSSVFGGIVISDFCVSNDASPAAMIRDIVDTREEILVDSLLYKSVMFYLDGCQDQIEPVINQYIPKLKELAGFISSLFSWSFIESNRQQLLNACDGLLMSDNNMGGDYYLDSETFMSQLSSLASSSVNLLYQVENLADKTTCNRVYPIYDRLINKGVCTNGARALFWYALPLLILSITSLLMISLRTAWKNIKLPSHEGKKKKTETGNGVESIESENVAEDFGLYDVVQVEGGDDVIELPRTTLQKTRQPE